MFIRQAVAVIYVLGPYKPAVTSRLHVALKDYRESK